ncbi:MAG: ORF6N domain-containing protein [Acidobacteriaceae bacterium]|nr:ORF6N domain-containing protein [Acidobacteriaceae bacterium]
MLDSDLAALYQIETGLNRAVKRNRERFPEDFMWFAKRRRFHVHFTPTYGSWMNLLERWFAEITNKRIRSGIFCSVKELEAAIREYLYPTTRAPNHLSGHGRRPDSGQHRAFRSADPRHRPALMTYFVDQWDRTSSVLLSEV